MLDPVVIPAPLALGVVAALAAILAVMRWRWLDTVVWPRPPARRPGRHRLADATMPFRDWAADTDPADVIAALAPPSRRMEIAGHDDRPAFADDTVELAAVR